MTFTDDDLKRVKESVTLPVTDVDSQDLKALLARLEAAENAVLSAKHSNDGLDFEVAYQVWRKACGRDK